MRREKYDKEYLINLIERLVKDLGRAPTVDEYKAMVSRPSIGVIQYKFASSSDKYDGWNRLMEMLGHKPRCKRFDGDEMCSVCGGTHKLGRVEDKILCQKCSMKLRRIYDKKYKCTGSNEEDCSEI
jgi:uncharacterized paraquat-inducible protein A